MDREDDLRNCDICDEHVDERYYKAHNGMCERCKRQEDIDNDEDFHPN